MDSRSNTEITDGSASAMTADELDKLRDEIRAVFAEHPPTIGIVGVSGVGKSSTINALFKTELATSDTVRCTTEFCRVELNVTVKKEQEDLTARLWVWDAPGLGEDHTADARYLEQYEKHLAECDVVLWIMAARNRAVALDQMYLQKLSQFKDKMLLD
jgi:predicted GTPase